MYSAKLLFPLSLILSGCFLHGNVKNEKVLEQKPVNNSILLINKTDKRLGFCYEDKYLNLIQVRLLPKDSSVIPADSDLLLTQTNENQNFYLLYPGDTLHAAKTLLEMPFCL